MPNINRDNPPKGLVFVHFRDTTVGASRYGGNTNIWLKIRKNANNDFYVLKLYTGCGTEYGIEVTKDLHKHPVFVQETS
jgi:hypothetical protein